MDNSMDKQQVVALVAAVAMLTAALLDATFTYGELPPSAQAPALQASPDAVAPPPASERMLAQAESA